MTISMSKTPMVDLQKTAKANLSKHGVEADGKGGVKVRLVLDHSGSMDRWYRSGAVQRLTEQVLALASVLDDDGTIETWYFGSGVSEVYNVSLNPKPMDGSYYVNWVARSHPMQPWGSTNYPAGLKAPVDFQKEKGEDEPALVIFQTDGEPDNQVRAYDTLRQLSGEKTFFAFIVFGEEQLYGITTRVGEFMHSLDTMEGRTRDNASTFFTGGLEKYATLSDEALYDGVIGEFVKKWLPEVL